MLNHPYEDCGCPPGKGHEHPRTYPEPLRDLTPDTSDGYRAILFAELLGLELLPWQKWFLIHALELREDGSPRFKTLVLLVSRQAGKTTLAVLMILFWLVIIESKVVVNSAQDLATAEEAWDSVVEMFRENEYLAGEMIQEPVMAAGKKALILTRGRRLLPKASNRKAGRGLSVDRLFMDEVREQRTWDAYDALTGTTIARRGSQILAASNAGDVESIVLAFLRDAGIADIKEGTDSGVGLFEWSMHEHDDPGDPENWRKSEPGLSYTITIPDMRAKYSTMPLTSFRTEYGTQWVARMDSPIDLVAWESMRDNQGDLRHVFRRAAMHMAVEVSHDGEHVTLVGGGMDQADSERPRVRTGVIKSWAGKSAVTEAEKDLKDIIDKVRPRDLAWFPSGPGGVLKVAISRIRSTRIVPYSGAAVASACASLSEQVSARAVINGGEPLMSTQILAAKRAPMGDGWRFEVKGIGAHVDALYATAAVVQQARLTSKRGALAVTSLDEDDEQQEETPHD